MRLDSAMLARVLAILRDRRESDDHWQDQRQAPNKTGDTRLGPTPIREGASHPHRLLAAVRLGRHAANRYSVGRGDRSSGSTRRPENSQRLNLSVVIG